MEDSGDTGNPLGNDNQGKHCKKEGCEENGKNEADGSTKMTYCVVSQNTYNGANCQKTQNFHQKSPVLGQNCHKYHKNTRNPQKADLTQT